MLTNSRYREKFSSFALPVATEFVDCCLYVSETDMEKFAIP